MEFVLSEPFEAEIARLTPDEYAQFRSAFELFTTFVDGWVGGSVALYPLADEFPPELGVHRVGDRWAFAWGAGAPHSPERAIFDWNPRATRARRVIMRNVATTHQGAYGANK
ncbi:MAG: hypothetical protein H7287_14155 [Thermoleophilia bacterium]|nr:hypothetical protein [Thermoleophilia bacterium]